MNSIIFEFIDEEDWEQKIAIGSPRYYQDTIRNSLQLIRTLSYEHTKEEWWYMCELQAEELYEELNIILDENRLKVEYPN